MHSLVARNIGIGRRKRTNQSVFSEFPQKARPKRTIHSYDNLVLPGRNSKKLPKPKAQTYRGCDSIACDADFGVPIVSQ